MRFLTVICLSTCFSVLSYARFAYEANSCVVKKLNLIADMLNNKALTIFNPTLKTTQYKQLQYDLYTSKNPYERQILSTNDVKLLKNSNFNPQWPIRFTLHGWTDHRLTCTNAALKDAYLSRGNFNVIIVDYSIYALDISYRRFSDQLQDIAATFVEFVHFLQRHTNVAYEQMYLIGHSAGCHVAGLAGKLLKPHRFGAIYALDPAGLTQLGLGAAHRLAPTDARYVETIHTDIELLGSPRTELSHAAFFVNYGLGQMHCPNASGYEQDFLCDHYAAIYYFAESIRNPQAFGAITCEFAASNVGKYKCSCGKAVKQCHAITYMGGEPAVAKQGIYYLSTRSATPYGYGNIVERRPAKKPNFLNSELIWKGIIKSILLLRVI